MAPRGDESMQSSSFVQSGSICRDSMGRGGPRPGMVLLALVFGLAQGCARDVFLSSAGYYGARFDDPNFFVWMCGVIYVAPFVIFPTAHIFDEMVDAAVGLRKSVSFRLLVPLLLGGFVDLALGCADKRGVGKDGVLFAGSVLGLLAGTAAHTASQFFGVIHPRLVSYWFLGNTCSGIYLNIGALFTGFEPMCSGTSAAAYYAV